MKAVGDTIFNHQGRPGVIVQRDPKGILHVDRQGEAFEANRPRGYINGLAQQERAEFNQMMDQVRKIEGAEQRVEQMQKILTELQDDPGKHVIRKYVEAEMQHYMLLNNIRPRFYQMDEQLNR